MEEQAERVRVVIERSKELSERGEVGKALDLLDDFFTDIIRENGNERIRSASGIPPFWLRRWVTPGAEGCTPSYISRVFLVMLLRSITSHGPQCMLSQLFGTEESWRSRPRSPHAQLVTEAYARADSRAADSFDAIADPRPLV